MPKGSGILTAVVVALLLAASWVPPVLAQPGVDSPSPRPPEIREGTILQVSEDIRVDCRGIFERVERLREDPPQRQSTFDAAVNDARFCIENGVEPPGGASSFDLSPEDFEKAEDNAESKAESKGKDKAKEDKDELPPTGGEGGAPLLALAVGALLVGGGILARRAIR